MNKKSYRFIALLLIATLILKNFTYNVSASQENNAVETIYMDGIEFEIIETEDGIDITGEYEGETVNVSYSGEETADVDISDGSSNDGFSLVFDDYDDIINDIVDDVDIDAFISADSMEDVIDSIDVEDVLDECSVNIYDEDNVLVDTVEFGGYEGQVAITVAGTASYYILSAVVSIIFTHEVYKIIKASTASKNRAKRGSGKAIPKNKVPGKAKKNKTVKGKNGSLPLKDTPNSSTDLYSKDGKKLYQRRFYDAKGKVYLDIDFSHGGNHKFPHAHYWIWY